MYDIARTPVQEHMPAHQPDQTSASLGQQIVALLEMALTQYAPPHPEPPISTKRPLGRPVQLRSEQLWLALLIGVIRRAKHLSSIWRTLCLEPTGSFPVVHLTYEAVRKRLLHAGTKPLQQLFETLSLAMRHWTMTHQPSALPIAAFATQVVALDETTLDAVRRLTADLRDLPKGDPHLLPGKLAGLFDLRQQRWVHMQFRADVLAGCNIGVLTLLTGLPTGSLILADLGLAPQGADYLPDQRGAGLR